MTKQELRNPEFEKAGRVHDWRNYATDEVKLLWHTFTDEQLQAIFNSLEEIASNEEWD